MSQIWGSLLGLKQHIITRLEQTGLEVHEEGMDRFNKPGWVNRCLLYTSPSPRD